MSYLGSDLGFSPTFAAAAAASQLAKSGSNTAPTTSDVPWYQDVVDVVTGVVKSYGDMTTKQKMAVAEQTAFARSADVAAKQKAKSQRTTVAMVIGGVVVIGAIGLIMSRRRRG